MTVDPERLALRASFAAPAEAEAERAERECPLDPDSAAAAALKALVGVPLRDYVLDRLARQAAEAA